MQIAEERRQLVFRKAALEHGLPMRFRVGTTFHRPEA
jgi:hypothetical protein